MPKTLIVTSASHHITPYCAEMNQNKADYARRHGLDYLCGAGFPESPHPSYDKLRLIEEGLKTHDLVISLGMDVCFTNFEKNIADVLPKEHWLGIAREGQFICCDIMFFRFCPESFQALNAINERIAASPKADVAARPWEQRYIIELWKEGKLPCALLPEDAVGGFAPEWHWWVNPENRSWQHGDLMVHMPIKPWAERRDLFVKTYMQKIIYGETL